MTPTTTAALSAAFVQAIHAIVPRYTHERASGWKFTPSGREAGGAEGLAGTALRSFDLIWEAGVPGEMVRGAAGEDFIARMRVATSYRGIDPRELEHMLPADAIDLRRTLMALQEPTVPGLIQVVHAGLGEAAIDDAANVVAEHAFLISWLQNTDAL